MTRKTTTYARKRSLQQLPGHARGQVLQMIKGDGITVNNLRNTPFSPEELEKLMREPTEALQVARQGRITYDALLSLSSAMHKGVAIEDARTIIRGFAEIYQQANAALAAIEARCTTTGRWVASPLYGPELTALDDLLWAYRKALEVCTYGEFYRAQALACSRTASQGQQVYTVGDVLQWPGDARGGVA